jgi:hypothetical protein
MQLQAVMASDVVLQLKLEMELLGHGFKYINRDRHGFRANTIAGQNNNFHGINSTKKEKNGIGSRKVALAQ